MAIQLLRTKLYIPPPRPELVPRPYLIKRLDAAIGLRGSFTRKLALVSGPAGFGKTTLVNEWVHSSRAQHAQMLKHVTPLHFTWLSLDEGDNDSAHFLTYFIAALNGIEDLDISFGKGALSILQSTQPVPVETVLTSLINEITAISSRIIFVLDDYHLIDSQAIHDGLTFLLEHLPPNMHLVIATRVDPPLPLARLRARDLLTEIRAVDLRFSHADATEFFNRVMGLKLSAEDISALDTKIEGWIAGLQLAAVSMQGQSNASQLIQSFSSSHRYVLDYLVEEVLEQQSESIHTFLYQTAILDRFTDSLCDAVTGQDNGHETLQVLDQANLFVIPLDTERHWYRYHHLFADLLCQRLRQTQPELISTLHIRASEWCELHGFTDEAIGYVLRSENYERAVFLIERVAEDMWERVSHLQLRDWLEALPVELVLTRPHLCVFHAGYLFASGEQNTAERYLRAAEQVIARTIDVPEEDSSPDQDQLAHTDRAKLLGRIAAIWAFMASYRSDAPGVIPHARLALQYLPQEDLAWRGAAAVTLGDAYIYQGQYVEAHRTYLDGLEALRVTGNTYLYMNASLKMALGLRSQGWLQRAIEICRQQQQLAQKSGMSETEMIG